MNGRSTMLIFVYGSTIMKNVLTKAEKSQPLNIRSMREEKKRQFMLTQFFIVQKYLRVFFLCLLHISQNS